LKLGERNPSASREFSLSHRQSICDERAVTHVDAGRDGGRLARPSGWSIHDLSISDDEGGWRDADVASDGHDAQHLMPKNERPLITGRDAQQTAGRSERHRFGRRYRETNSMTLLRSRRSNRPSSLISRTYHRINFVRRRNTKLATAFRYQRRCQFIH